MLLLLLLLLLLLILLLLLLLMLFSVVAAAVRVIDEQNTKIVSMLKQFGDNLNVSIYEIVMADVLLLTDVFFKIKKSE